ncbi:MAG: hypothetical protein R3202_14500, partial [Candidatus Competibacterales bacterium]|nr:hypothetical protein [Candidatus Competibacterales bacterium]
CEPDQAEAVERLILDTLERVAAEGVPVENVEAMLHQLELAQREISGDGFPYGLQLILQTLAPTIHGGDPVAALDLDAQLEQLRADCRDPGFIPGLVRRLLLDNPHRVRLVMAPDPEQGAREATAERERLDALRQRLDADARQQLVARARALAQRQQQADDPEQLPRVGLADVAPDLDIPEGEDRPLDDLPARWYARGTNGMAYAQLVLDLPALEPELRDLLPLYATCLTEVGCDGRDYLAQQARQAAGVGGLGASLMVRNDLAAGGRPRAVLILAGKALVRQRDALAELLTETLDAPRFDEQSRLRELVAQLRAAREAGVTRAGHALAMTAASSGLNAIAALAHRWDGLAGLRALQSLDDTLDQPGTLARFAECLQTIHQALRTSPRRLLVVSEADQQGPLADALGSRLTGLPAPEPV